MDIIGGFGSFLSVETLVFCMVIAIITHIIKKIANMAAPKLGAAFGGLFGFFGNVFDKVVGKVSKLAFLLKFRTWLYDSAQKNVKYIWADLILPGMPLVLGVLFAIYVPMFPYPGVWASTLSARVSFGFVSGFFSAYVFRAVNAHVKRIAASKSQDLADKVEGVIGDPDKP